MLQSIWLWFNSYCWFPRQISQCCHLLNDDGYKKKCKHKKIYKLQIFILKAHFRAYTTIFIPPLPPFFIFFLFWQQKKNKIHSSLKFLHLPSVVASSVMVIMKREKNKQKNKTFTLCSKPTFFHVHSILKRRFIYSVKYGTKMMVEIKGWWEKNCLGLDGVLLLYLTSIHNRIFLKKLKFFFFRKWVF